MKTDQANCATVVLRRRRYRTGDHWTLAFRHDKVSVAKAKAAGGSWNAEHGLWLIPLIARSYASLKQLFGPETEWDERTTAADRLPALEGNQDKSLQIFKLWLVQRRYSNSTQKTYIEAARLFLRFLQQRVKVDAKSVDSQDIHALIHDYVVANGFSRSYQNQVVNSLMFYFRAVDGLHLELDGAERPRREHRLPHLLSKEDVKRLLEMTGNAKHRTMLSLIYACGLRRGELLALKLSDIDGERTVLRVRAGKGEKDQRLPISEKVLAMLREYYREFRPKVWWFEGECEGVRDWEMSLQQVFKRVACRACVLAEATLHWLRCSYATHYWKRARTYAAFKSS